MIGVQPTLPHIAHGANRSLTGTIQSGHIRKGRSSTGVALSRLGDAFLGYDDALAIWRPTVNAS